MASVFGAVSTEGTFRGGVEAAGAYRVPLSAKMARAQVDLFSDMKTRAEKAEAALAAAQAERDRAVAALDYVDSWVSNPVGAYSVGALDGLFGLTRDKIAAIRSRTTGGADA